MEGLLKPLYEIEQFNKVLDLLKRNQQNISIAGLFESQKVHFASGFLNEMDKPCIFITFNELSAKKYYEDFRLFFGDRVVYYPQKEIIPHYIEAESIVLSTSRLNVLDKMINSKNYIIVLSFEALQSKIMPKDILQKYIRKLKVGERYDLKEIQEYFSTIGYSRLNIIEGKGQFSIRGSIVDFFPTNSINPFRIDFFDDEIDSIKTFDIDTQRSISNINEVKVFPSKELFFSLNDAKIVAEKIKSDLEEYTKTLKEMHQKEKIQNRIGGEIEKIENGISFAGIDKYISYFYEEAGILDYLQDDGVIIFDEQNKAEITANSYLNQFKEIIKDSIEKGNILPSCTNYINDYNSTVEKHFNNKQVVNINTFELSNPEKKQFKFNIESRPSPSFNGKINLLIDQIKQWKEEKKRIFILAGTKGKCDKFGEVLNDNGIDAHVLNSVEKQSGFGEVFIGEGSLSRGFEYSSINFVVISDKEIFGENKSLKRRKKKLGQKIRTFSELQVGDYVVHQMHGIGQYIGIEKLKVEGVIKDYFKIKYQKGDLFLPISNLDLIQKYIGSEGKQPKISKLGGSDWIKAKSKVKNAVEDLARELVRLYAQRELVKGFAFAEDNVWQNQFEETFPYQETDDQLQCIKEVKEDMEKEKPMDRLLCGDVGYGKTEVAIRAAFKAVMGGKQVAYLVPTTILAQQQFSNFVKRMKDFAITVELLSRFRTPVQQKKIIKDVKNGLVDIIIGTHRIIQKDVIYKDLGLIIVDEEQRFGVSDKEKLKAIKNNVDVLTLTATPIPRTLHMSLLGVRDMSVIEEPPEERYPVQTYVLEYDDEIIKEAIIRELSRGGQVFYLHNRVSSIHKVVTLINKLVPEARVVYAHGQMSKNDLEDITMNFIDGEYDVLVCTTIIETGIDMPNVNTIIIEDADKMGLAQLYQLRGRVGRSNRQAFAYLMFKRDKVLSEEAEKRLKAIKEFTEFGSGFKIAMRDLEIRGAGNLIGSQQHGHMDSVGYEMYCKILDETVRELKGEKIEETIETSIDLSLSAYIDETYIGDYLQKINMYKKIASIRSEDDIMDIRDELLDVYGAIPTEVDNLIEIAGVKALCSINGIINVVQKNNNIIFTFNKDVGINIKVIGELSNIYRGKLLFSAGNPPYITLKTNGIINSVLLKNIKIMLQNMNSLQQNN